MPQLDDAALALLLEALTDHKAHRRLLVRLRPRVAGWPHRKRRLVRMVGAVIRAGV